MKILSLNLQGFKRMLLNDVKSFTIEPTESIQLVLGTNGSGKSSLLQELTPLPGSSNDFTTDGSKSISLEHYGTMYDLKSTFSSTQKHNFFKAGIELNHGGTLSVQKELVKQEFGITTETQALLTNQISFSKMSIADRRYWFTKLADTDFDYAISVYNKLREKSRDISGSLKVIKNRLVTETAKIISIEERQTIEKEVDDLHNLLQHLLEYRKPIDKSLDQLKLETIKIENQITISFTNLMKKKNQYKDINLTIDETDSKLKELESKKTVDLLLIDKNFVEFNILQESINFLEETGSEGSEELKLKIDNLNTSKQNILNRRKLNFVIENPEIIKSAFETVYDTLTNVFIILPKNSDRKYSKNNLTELSNKIISIKDILEKLESDSNKILSNIKNQEHQKTHDSVECPKCMHKWTKGFDEVYYNGLHNSLKIIQNKISEKNIELNEYLVYKNEILDYIEIYKQFSSCVNNWPSLSELWNYILKDNLITDNPKMLLNTLELFKFDIGLELEANVLNNQTNKTIDLLKMSEKMGEADITKLKNNLLKIENDISNYTLNIQNYTNEIKSLELYKRDILDILNLAQGIDLLGKSYVNTYHDSLESFRRGALNDVIKSLRSMLSKKEVFLSEIRVQAGIIQDIENQIITQELDDISYKALIKELSPTDGLIAQGLLSFIRSFTKQMNSFIKGIWIYPLEITPCGLTEDGLLELDYKFPLVIQDNENKISDVAKGSSAMREVIDLAFRIIAMKYLGLEEAPLILDEFSSSFDSAHRVAATQAIKTLMEQHSFTQLFMVSHYEGSYLSLTNAQICVLCGNNITIPKNAIINQHVIME